MKIRFWGEDATASAATDDVAERSEMDTGFQWNVADMYASDSDWDQDFGLLEDLVKALEQLRGKLNSAETLAQFLERETRLDRVLEKLYVYAHLRADEDTRDNTNQARDARIRARYSEIAGRLAWATPEILANSEESIREWAESETLRENRYAIVKLLRRKPHVLSEPEETLLSRAGEIFSCPSRAFNFLTNADMQFPRVKDHEGNEKQLSEGRYITFLQDRDRRVRRDAFHALYDTYSGLKNTLACTLSSNVKLHNYSADTRHFASALEAALHEDNIPADLYLALIQSVHDALPEFYSYVALRARSLGIDDLNMYDFYVPMVPEYNVQVPFEQAKEWVLAACAPLGDEYLAGLRSAFNDGWIDVYENRGKRSGAYSSGCYDSLPYVLLNYQGTLDDVFTLAHELGHSMHSWLANRAQPHRFARYPIFVAEIASTLNESLLLHHLLDTREEPAFRAYLLNHLCDSFKGTVYRQTMFAEFEKMIHEMDRAGEPLTPDALSERYYELNALYYGDGIKADQQIQYEWSRIPHFYYNFYVYKYATSFCASQIFSQRVLAGGEDRDSYLELLSAGGSDDPLAMVRTAGVDLLDPATFRDAFATFGEKVAELGDVLGNSELGTRNSE